MQQWELNKENLDTVRGIAKEWEQGVITLKQLRNRENELHWSSPYTDRGCF